MKKILYSLIYQACFLISVSAIAQQELTKKERDYALDHLKMTQKALNDAIDGLSKEQLNFKPTPESWSVANCVEHLAISESAFFGLTQQSLQTEANPDLRSELPFNDEQILGFITDRSTKVKTQPPFEPKNNFESYDGSLNEFTDKRKASIKFMKRTKDDFRNHYYDFPFGKVDAYQVVLFMSGHTTRHTAQIKEVMTHADFPKS